MATSVLDDLINTHGRPLDNGGTILPNSVDDINKPRHGINNGGNLVQAHISTVTEKAHQN